MSTELIISFLLLVLAVIIASFVLFYKSWVSALGKELAKLSTIEKLTDLAENVKKDFKEKLEVYKLKLSEELTMKIEPLKSELAKNNITYQIQFGFLHQERAKVILELYKRLIELHTSMVDWTNPVHLIIEDAEIEDVERAKRAHIAIFDFWSFYHTNKLFFSKTFCDDIDEVFKDYSSKKWDFAFKKNRIKSGQLPKQYFDDYNTDMARISEELKVQLPTKIEEIEKKFRKILNVEEE